MTLRIRFIGNMPRKGYSGGRLLALTMAEALACTGARVDFLVNNIPEMYDEFRSFSWVQLRQVDFSSLNLSYWVDRQIDVVVIVPHQGGLPEHGEWLRHAIECRARIVLLNFESPNWFNEVSPHKRDPKLWAGWDLISEYAHLILSISGEGDKYARSYYRNCRPDCRFDFTYPGINTVLADQAPFSPTRARQVVMLTRVDSHKGFNDLDPLIQSDLGGYRVVLVLGNGKIDPQQIELRRRQFAAVNMEIEVRTAISSLEKFTLLKQSALLYFPSRFEGFGLPPLEAAYCLTPTACSNLPVLREFGQKAFVYGAPEVVEDMRRAVITALGSQEHVRKEHPRIGKIAKLDEYGYRLEKLIQKILI